MRVKTVQALEELAGWQTSEQPGSPSSEDVKRGWARFVAEGHLTRLSERERVDLMQLLCGVEGEKSAAHTLSEAKI